MTTATQRNESSKAPRAGGIQLRFPIGTTLSTRRLFARGVEGLLEPSGDPSAGDDGQWIEQLVLKASEDERPLLRAGLLVLHDLRAEGWSMKRAGATVLVDPGERHSDPSVEKERVRAQELRKRAERLKEPSVRRFVREMETKRRVGGAYVSVFDLMRDGEALEQELRKARGGSLADLREVIDPYVQVVDTGQRCTLTGLKLTDVWRYFRLTWSNQLTSTPGRQMLVLVRDRAAPFHPVIGIGAIGSAVVQIAVRDQFIGWDQESVASMVASEKECAELPGWLARELERAISELYLGDFFESEILRPGELKEPSDLTIEALRALAERTRASHHGHAGARSELRRRAADEADWMSRARSDLFTSKRAEVLADLLQARLTLNDALVGSTGAEQMASLLSTSSGRSAFARIVRRARADRVGTEIGEVTVCGSIAPYNELIGGKLIAALLASPPVVEAYHRRYARAASEIASSMAGREIVRPSRLAYIGTTSLYGSGSSQYNRLVVPAEAVGGLPGETIRYRELGRSEAFGTGHLSESAVAALVALAEHMTGGSRVNNIFGEGVSPKLRKIRTGLDLLGWDATALLRHGRPRIVYGVALARNMRRYLLGFDLEPEYIFDPAVGADGVVDWWMERWMSRRVHSDEVLERVAQNDLAYPVTHRARVELPDTDDDPADG